MDGFEWVILALLAVLLGVNTLLVWRQQAALAALQERMAVVQLDVSEVTALLVGLADGEVDGGAVAWEFDLSEMNGTQP